MTFRERCEDFGTEHAQEGGQCELPALHDGPHRFEGASAAAPSDATAQGTLTKLERGPLYDADAWDCAMDALGKMRERAEAAESSAQALATALRVALAHVTHEETTTASEPTKDAMRGIAKRLRAALAAYEGKGTR